MGTGIWRHSLRGKRAGLECVLGGTACGCQSIDQQTVSYVLFPSARSRAKTPSILFGYLVRSIALRAQRVHSEPCSERATSRCCVAFQILDSSGWQRRFLFEPRLRLALYDRTEGRVF